MLFHSHGGSHGLWNGLLQRYDSAGRDDKSGVYPCSWRTSYYVMGVIAFFVEFLFVERIVKRIAFRCVDPQNPP